MCERGGRGVVWIFFLLKCVFSWEECKRRESFGKLELLLRKFGFWDLVRVIGVNFRIIVVKVGGF